MPLEKIFSFLTYPKKNDPDEPLAPGTKLSFDGKSKLGRMLDDIFRNSDRDCIVPILFTTEGDQHNPARSELISLVKKPTIKTAAPLALRLQRSTSGTSGMGLMFICLGEENGSTRVVISRFPADEGVVAERTDDAKLTVQFVEQVFLKSANSYKAATYLADDRPDQMWKGHVVDRQINHGTKAVADYWIVDFLRSEFATTAAAGTKRLAIALRKTAASTTSAQVKQEITSAAQLAINLTRQATTIAGFCKRFNFSEETTKSVLSNVRPPRLVNERFRFDSEEFGLHLAYKQIELDNGAILVAPADKFEQVYRQSIKRNEHTFSTTGEIVDQRLRRTK